jgi:hypothetical protein
MVDGLMRCPGCGLGVHMVDGGCNVTTCRHASKHGGRYYYFCAHCKAESSAYRRRIHVHELPDAQRPRDAREGQGAPRERERVEGFSLSSSSVGTPSEVC